MSRFVRWAGIALLAVLAVVPAARQAEAQAADSAAIVLPPSDPPTAAPVLTDSASIHVATPVAAPKPAAAAFHPGLAPGRAGLSGGLGGSWIWAEDDYAEGALPRFNLLGSFRYQMTERWRLQLSPGFTWNAYTKHASPPYTDPLKPDDLTKQHYLTLLTPFSAQIQWVGKGTTWIPHYGIGPGVYRVVVEHDRDDLFDPITFKVHRGVYLGATIEAGMERFMKGSTNVSVEMNLINHFIVATRDDQFPAGWNSGIANVAVNVALNYYFDLARLKQKEPTPLPR